MNNNNGNQESKVTSASYAGFKKPVIEDKNMVLKNMFGYMIVRKDDPKDKELVVKKTVGGYTIVGFTK